MNTVTLTSNSPTSPGVVYYDGPEIVERLARALTDSGLDPHALDVDDLAPLDEFHALGRAATVALADLAGVGPGQRVLDVGAGIGGPARVLAAHYGAQVTALDATPRFCRAAEMLTRATGLSDRVEVVCGDALALPSAEGTFDLVWTQAVSQNIADKQRFVSEMARVLKPGGHVALFEVLRGPGGPLEFPVPWADSAEQSWLVSPSELRGLLERAPLELVTWNMGEQVTAAIVDASSRVKRTPGGAQLGLHLLMPDFQARMAGLARNVAEEKITLVQAVARRR
jgi:SAM-dependent methyltransferase